MDMVKKMRSDCTVGTFEKTRGLPPGTVRNSDGRDTRSDKRIGTVRRESEKASNYSCKTRGRRNCLGIKTIPPSPCPAMIHEQNWRYKSFMWRDYERFFY